eukprot:UN09658
MLSAATEHLPPLRIARHNNYNPLTNLHDAMIDDDEEEICQHDIGYLIQVLSQQQQEQQSIENTLNSVKNLRRLSALVDNPLLDDIVDNNGIPTLISLLSHESDEICCEAAWCLINITSSPNTTYIDDVVNDDAIEHLIALLSRNNNNNNTNYVLYNHVLCLLGNIVGESSEYRDVILSHNIISMINQFIQHNPPNIPLLRTIAWVLCNFCRCANPRVDF